MCGRRGTILLSQRYEVMRSKAVRVRGASTRGGLPQTCPRRVLEGGPAMKPSILSIMLASGLLIGSASVGYAQYGGAGQPQTYPRAGTAPDQSGLPGTPG